MGLGELWFWIGMLALGVIVSYSSVPGLVQALQNQAPFEYNDLGCPDAWELLAGRFNGLQHRFAWFVVSGKAYAVTHGTGRTSAIGAWLGYVITAVALLALLVRLVMDGR